MKQVYRAVSFLLLCLVTGCGSIQVGSLETPTAQPPVARATVPAASPTTPPATATTIATAEPTATPPEPTAASTVVATDVAATPGPNGTAAAGGAVRADLNGNLLFARGRDLWVYTPHDGAVRRVLQNAREARWSPDASTIVFVRDDGVYMANADGGDERLVHEAQNAHAPVWASGGSRIAFELGTVADAATTREVWVYDLAGDEARKVGDGTDPAWAPDGERIAYVTVAGDEVPRRTELRVVDWHGKNASTIVRDLPSGTPAIGIPDSKMEPADLEHVMLDPFWNADGTAVYVASYVGYQALVGFSIWERADATKGGSTFLGELPEVMRATPAPNRKAALFSVSSARGDTWFVARGVETDDADWSWAEIGNGVMAESPAWSPDSAAVAYYQCGLENPEDCDLLVRNADGEDVLVEDVFGTAAPDRAQPLTLDWADDE